MKGRKKTAPKVLFHLDLSGYLEGDIAGVPIQASLAQGEVPVGDKAYPSALSAINQSFAANLPCRTLRPSFSFGFLTTHIQAKSIVSPGTVRRQTHAAVTASLQLPSLKGSGSET